MSKRRTCQPSLRENEVFLDSDSESEREHSDNESDEFVPSDSDENRGEESEEEGVDLDLFTDPQPSTSRASVNVRGRSRRGRGVTRGRIPLRRLEKGQIDQLWSEEDIDNPPQAPQFTGNPGIQVQIDPDASAWEYFQQFVDDGLLQHIVEQTNLYAAQYKEALGQAIKTHSLLADWKDTTMQEMKLFLGLLFLMGIVDKPDLKSYWSTDPLLETPIYGKSMSRNRFEAILMAFHLTDNRENLPRDHPDHDKLFKVRPVVDHLQDRFGAVYSPKQNLAIDESMMPWRGRVAFRQFIPSKPIRYGIKLYMCCESDSSYVCKMEIYSGKKGGKTEKDHGPNVVKRLAEDFNGKGHTIFIDSFFSSVDLFEDMRKKGTTMTGTIRKDRRGLPSQLAEKKIQRGEVAEMKKRITPNEEDPLDTSASLHAFKYHDKKMVTLLSSCSTGRLLDSGKKTKSTNQPIMIPEVVHRYNHNMNGVDQFDQHIQYYSFNRKTWKWWKRACFHLLHLAKVQSYLIYKMNNPRKKTSQLQFTLDLIRDMLADAPPAKPFKRRPSDPPARLQLRHFPSKVPATATKKHPTRVCVVCSVRKESGKGYKTRKESAYECKECNKGLCMGKCFEVYHTNVSFKKPKVDEGGDHE